MRKIVVYGPGCNRCKVTEEIVRRAISESGCDAEVEKISDLKMILAAGVFSTPAVAVDGVLRVKGRIPEVSEVKDWLAQPANV
jgi:small redox-active disulfide protein 2